MNLKNLLNKIFIRKPRELGVNKYFLYIVTMIYLASPLAEKAWDWIRFTKATGVEDYYVTDGSGTRMKYYCRIKYVAENDTLYFMRKYFQNGASFTYDPVPIIYDPKNAGNVYETSFHAYWAMEFIFFIVFGLLLSMVMLGLDDVPNYLTIRI